MLNLSQIVGLLGAELPLSALGALLLLVFYRGLRDERFLRSWMIFEFSQTAFLSGTLFLLFHEPIPAVPHVIQTGTAIATFLIGGARTALSASRIPGGYWPAAILSKFFLRFSCLPGWWDSSDEQDPPE